MLGSGDQVQFQAVLQAARLGVVGSISAVSTETASHINPAMVRLQMLEALSEAWIIVDPASGNGGPADPAVVARRQQLWHSREQAAGELRSHNH